MMAQSAMDDPKTALIAVPLLISFFLITGLRVVFDLPAALSSNWVFQSAAADPRPLPGAVARRFMFLFVLSWQPVLLIPLLTQRLGWPAACEITALNMAFSALAVDLLLSKYNKIPFTYLVHKDSPQIVMRIIGALLGAVLLVPILAALERWTLKDTSRFGLLACLLGLVFYEMERRRRIRSAQESVLTFEERPTEAFELLKLA
jgi:dipeptide/tripeptide permease